MDIHERWELVTRYGEEYGKFDHVLHKLSKRPDVHAIMMLDKLFDGSSAMIVGSYSDEIWFDVHDDAIKSLTDDQIIELSRCGVRHDQKTQSLCMFI
jgi:hypothetical protein